MDISKVMILSQGAEDLTKEEQIEIGKLIRRECLLKLEVGGKKNTVGRNKAIEWLTTQPIDETTIHSRVYKSLQQKLPQNVLTSTRQSTEYSYMECDEVWLVWTGDKGICQDYFVSALSDDKTIVIFDLKAKEVGKMNAA